MAPPSLKDYYTSAQLKPLVYWCNPSYVAKWKTVELSLTDTPIQSLLGCVGKEKEQTASRWVNFSLKIWVEVVKCFQLQKEVKLLNWPAYDSEFTPALLDHSGITAMCNIVRKGELDSFNNLCQIYGLGGQDLQLRDYFNTKVKGFKSEELPPIIHTFIDAYNSGNNKDLVGKLYRRH